MKIFDGRYFYLNKKLSIIVGLWPHEIKSKTRVRIFYISMMMLFIMPEFISAILHYDDIDRFMLNVLICLLSMLTTCKIIGLIVAEDNMKETYEMMANNWLEIQDENEREIIYKYSEYGRLATLLYTVSFFSSVGLMALMPLLPKAMDLINPLDEARPSIDALKGEYFVDRDEYFLPVFLSDTWMTILVTVSTVAMDAMYIVVCLHCCAMYDIVGHRLQKLSSSMNVNVDESNDWMCRTIELHQKALRFTSTLRKTYSKGFFVQLTVFILLIPLDACALMANLDNLLNVYIYTAVLMACSVASFIACWPGQMILNCQLNVCNDAYCNQWYTTSINTKKLLLTFMMRCWQPIILTAGGIMMLNFETYSVILRTAISYITVLASFRNSEK